MRKSLNFWAVFLSCNFFTVIAAGQTCSFFDRYPNSVKTKCKEFIDSLQKSGVDTILFYGVGIGDSGAMINGKIIWATEDKVQSVEILSNDYGKREKQTNLTTTLYNTSENRESLQFYIDKKLDTVQTNPLEIVWKSHDLLHYVFASVSRTFTCFVAEDYLLLDKEHLRSKWIIIFRKNL